MKVLVISLLRIGDFIQIVPVLNALRTQFPQAELDVLTHTPVRQLEPMLGPIANWWTIDREQLQEGLGRADVPLLTSFSLLKEQLDQINAREYDCVINLTQTSYAAWIAGYLNTANRIGLAMDVKGQAQFHSPWFQYLDDHAPLAVRDIFHYTDIFYYGSGLKGTSRDWQMRETERGISEVAALNLEVGERIVLQVATSDAKKTWSENSWLAMMSQLQLFRPEAQFVLLGAPSEAALLESLRLKAVPMGLHIASAVVSLEGALSLLKSAQLLITGDTSIKHLANAAGIAICELSMGSSDLRRTGAYIPDSLILQPVIECAPCPHSSPCSQTTHRCALQLAPEMVSTTVHHYLNQNWVALKQLAAEFASEIKILRTRVTASGFWMACDLNDGDAEQFVEKMVERCTWKFLLNRDHLDPIAKFGSEGVHIKRELDESFASPNFSNMQVHLQTLERRAGTMGEKAAILLNGVRRRAPAVEDIRHFIAEHQPLSSSLSWLDHLRSAKDNEEVVSIGGLRRVHNQLERFVNESQVKVKLIRSLKSQLTESK